MESLQTVERGDFDKIHVARVKRARIQAIAFGSITSLALICIVYSFVQLRKQAQEAVELKGKIEQLTIQLQNCNQAK